VTDLIKEGRKDHMDTQGPYLVRIRSGFKEGGSPESKDSWVNQTGGVGDNPRFHLMLAVWCDSTMWAIDGDSTEEPYVAVWWDSTLTMASSCRSLTEPAWRGVKNVVWYLSNQTDAS
jgi:hypothetical protein